MMNRPTIESAFSNNLSDYLLKTTRLALLAMTVIIAGAGTVIAQEQTDTENSPLEPGHLSDEMVATSITHVRALDKITAAITELDLPADQAVRFGTLSITARSCRTRPPEEPPETFAFLEIDEVKRDGTSTRIFSGWMMASSPALNALEHAVYDVWVMSCTIVEAGASAGNE
jgi:hypothetical protein